MSPLEDARARAERLRSYKADLQKLKKREGTSAYLKTLWHSDMVRILAAK